jgi:hypothetical protein
MKKIITIINLFFVLTFFGQTKIYETELSKKGTINVQCQYSFDLNKIIVNSVAKNNKHVSNESKIIDENAKVVDLATDETFTSIYFSDTENVYYTKDILGYYKPANYSFYVNGEIYKVSKKINKKELNLNKVEKYLKTEEDYFNKDRLLFLTGDKDDDIVLNIEKDNFFLNVFDFKNDKIKKIKLEKPNYKRLKGEDKMRLKAIGLSKDHPSSFSTNYSNDKFEIYSKTTFVDQDKSIIYRTIYNDLGKIEKDIQYNISLDNYTFGYMKPINSFDKNRSHTSSNIYTYTSGKYTYNRPVVDLDINDFFIDSNSDFYVFGMYIKEESIPGGYYIHKFSSDGNLIWKKTYEIIDENNFNQKRQDWNMTGIALQQYSNQNQLVLNLKGPSSYRDRKNHYFVIDKNNGDLLKKSEIETSTDYNTFGAYKSFGHTYFNTFTKKLNLSDDGLLAYSLNDKIKNKIDSYSKPKDDMYFDAIISSKGIWLIETDNDSKYSITLYK